MYAQKYMGVRYFLEYSLGNTKTYKTIFGPLCNSIGHTLGLGRHPLLFDELVVAPFPINILYPLSFLTPFYALRLPIDRFVSVLCVLVLPEEELLMFRFKKVMLDYLAL
jgi:hypothetical protein